MQNPTILAVDDQGHIRQMLTVALELCGYRVVTARDGVDALKQLSENSIDLLLTDWSMPTMNGAELVRHINTDHPDLPVIVVSCHEEKECIESSQLSIHNWLQKPFGIREIQTLVSSTLNDLALNSAHA